MIFWLIVIFASAGLLILATRLLIQQTRIISDKFRLSKLFISLVLMAIGTSLPELTVSTLALSRNDAGLAIGNIVGSNITNSTLGLGVGILLGGLRIGTTKTQQNSWILVLVTALFITLYLLPFPLGTAGILLVGVAIGVLIWQYVTAVRGREHEDKLYFLHLPLHPDPISIWQIILRSTLGIALLVISGTLLVASVEELSVILDISTTVLGSTLAALATTMPELVSTVVARRQHEDKIAVGNVLGSNIYNLCFIGGVASLRISTAENVSFELAVLTVVTIVFFAIIKLWKGQVIPQVVGIALILSYALYLMSSVLA